MGKGLVVNNKTKQETFMKVVELQAGSDFMWDANLNLGGLPVDGNLLNNLWLPLP